MADLLLDLDALEVHDSDDFQDEFEELLDGPARAARGDVETAAVADLTETPVIAGSLRELLEASVTAWIKAKFDEKKHPRWPKNTPGGKAGQFMQVGERFIGADGKPYEITAFQNGKVYAHLATGKATDVKTISLDVVPSAGGEMIPATHNGKQITPAPAQAYKMSGDKSHSGDVAGTIVIDPFVQADHDPSIKPPEGFTVTPEQWQRFGKEDQERVHALIERFGKWTPGSSKSLINEIRKQYDSESKSIVENALQSQYGSSSGSTISLSKVFGSTSSPAALQAAQVKYEKAKLLLEDAASALQWDLYHRTRAPDVCTFHWGGTSPSSQKSMHVNQGIPIMPAYSMSTGAFQTTQFGSNLTAVPLAIRHVQMHTHGGGIYTSYESEYEITTGHRMKLDGRALFTSQGSMGSDVKKYLDKMAPKAGEPASGQVLYEVQKAIADPSYELPLPPEPPGIKAVPVAGEKSYEMPPLDWVQQKGFNPFEIGYVGGDKEAATKPAHESNFKPGDMMEGLKGTRYLLIEDTAAPSGLRYVKVDPSTGMLVPSKSYALSGDQPFRKLDVSIDLPVKIVAQTDWVPMSDPEVKALKKAGPPTKVKMFAKGAVFVADGTPYKVTKTSQETGGNPVVISLSAPAEKEFTVNSGFKTEPMAHDGDYVPPPAPVMPTPAVAGPSTEPGVEGPAISTWVPKPGELALVSKKQMTKKALLVVNRDPDNPDIVSFAMPNGEPAQAAGGHIDNFDFAHPPKFGVDKIEVGDAFPHDGKKYVVSSILKDGTVRAKPTGGKVEKFEPGHGSLKNAWRATAWEQGDKIKLFDAPAGTVLHGGQGQKIRPYLVVATTPGKAKLLNLETNEVTSVSKAKSMTVLHQASSSVPASEDPKPQGPPSKHVLEGLVPSSEKTNAGEFVKQGGGYWVPLNASPGESLLHVYRDSAQIYQPGDDLDGGLIHDVPVGMKFDPGNGEIQTITAKGEITGPDGKADQFSETATFGHVTVISSPESDLGWKMVFVDPQTGEPLPNSTPQHLTNPDGSLNSLWATAEGYPMVQPGAADPQPESTIDGAKWQKSPLSPTDVSILKTGLLVSLQSHPFEKYMTKGLNDDGEMVVEPLPGSTATVPWKPGVMVDVWTPKKDAPEFDYAQMSKGDTVVLDGLKEGDVFEMPELHPGFFMKVLTPAAGDQDAHLEVLAPDGSKFEFDMGPKNAVIFHAHADAGPDMNSFAATPTPAKAPAMAHADESPFALATVPNFDPYLHPKGGKKKNDKVLTMAPGTVFKDKSGKLYEVKHAGYATAVVVSDGEALYKMDGDLRGQVITDQASINAFKSNDQAGPWPPPGEPASTDAPNVAQLKVQMTPSKIALYGLEPGDYFQQGTEVYKLDSKEGISHYFTNVETGAGSVTGGATIADAYLKNTPEKYGPDDPDPGDAAHKSDFAGGDVIIDAETGHKMVVVPWQTVIATGKQLDGAPDTHIGFYDWTATEVKVVKAEDLFDQELPGGFHPGDTAKAYTVALGATDVTVIAMRNENLVEKLKVKLPNGDIELLPMSAVTPLETHTPDGEKVRLPDMDTATWNHTETTAIKTPAELKLGQFFDVAAGGNAEVPQYMVTAKKDGKTTLTVLGTGTVGGVPHTYPDDTDISSGWGKSIKTFELVGPGETPSVPEGLPEPKTFGDLDVGDIYTFNPEEPEAPKFKVLSKGAEGIEVQSLPDGDEKAVWPPSKAFAKPPTLLSKGGGTQYGEDLPHGTPVHGGFAVGDFVKLPGDLAASAIVKGQTENGTVWVQDQYGTYDFDPSSLDLPEHAGDIDPWLENKASDIDPLNVVADPAPTTAPTTTQAAKDAGWYVVTPDKVAKSELRPFQLIRLPGGKIGYMGGQSSTTAGEFDATGKVFELGSVKPSATKAQKFQLVSWNGPQFSGDQELVETGPQVPLGDLPVGAFFRMTAGGTPGEYQVIGKMPGAEGGLHARRVTDGVVLHGTNDGAANFQVTPLALSHTSNDDPAPSEIPETAPEELEVGDTFHFQPDNPYPYAVTSTGPSAFIAAGMPGTPNAGQSLWYEYGQIPKVFKVTKKGAAGQTIGGLTIGEPLDDEPQFKPGNVYVASKLPPGSVVKSGGDEAEITKNGLVAKWGQPIPGSENSNVEYLGPPVAAAEPEPQQGPKPKEMLPGGFHVGQHVIDGDGDHVVLTGRSELNNGQSVHATWPYDWDDETNSYKAGSSGSGWDISKSGMSNLAPWDDPDDTSDKGVQQAPVQSWQAADPPPKGTAVLSGDLRPGDSFTYPGHPEGDFSFFSVLSAGEDGLDVAFMDQLGQEKWQATLGNSEAVIVHSIGPNWPPTDFTPSATATTGAGNVPTTVEQIYSGVWPSIGWSFRLKLGGPLFTVNRVLTDNGSLVAENPDVGEVHLNPSSQQPIYDVSHPTWEADIPF